MKRKAFELSLVTAVIITLLFSGAEKPTSCWWFAVFPNSYSELFTDSMEETEIRLRLLELFGEDGVISRVFAQILKNRIF